MKARWLGAVLVGGCAVPENEFLLSYAEAVCQVELDCIDPALRTFEGSTMDSCLAELGPEVEGWGEGCRYRGGRARDCLDALASVPCPSGSEVGVLPAACYEVYNPPCGPVPGTSEGQP